MRKILLTLCLFLLPQPTQAQFQSETETSLSLELWPRVHRHYIHQYRATVRGSASYNWLQARGYIHGVFWQSDKSKIPRSPVNAENNMNQEVRYGASLVAYLWKKLHTGLTLHRTEFHVVWRFKNQNGYRDGYGNFENNPSWRKREKICRSGNGCGSIAYSESAGIVLGWRDSTLSATARYLFWRYKELTFVPRPLRLRLMARKENWRTELSLHLDLASRARWSMEVGRRIYRSLWIGARAARVQPDHKKAFTLFGLSLTVRNR